MIRARLAVKAAAANGATAQVAKPMKALNITKSNLVDSQGGQATRNVDGVVYTITWNATEQKVCVVDRVNRLEYDAVVGDKDNRVSILLDSARPAGGPASFEQLQAVLRGDAPGPEIVNGRVAMMAFLGVAGVEIATGQTVLAQLASPGGAAAAAVLALATMAASIAPAVVGNVKPDKVFPDCNDSYPDQQLPYYFSPLAEIINGRVAMVGLAGLVINEVIRGAPLF